ncbi:MAG TPA: HlyD family efflux transporter periplasmic adaptor subunit [Gemmataceae bacterium]
MNTTKWFLLVGVVLLLVGVGAAIRYPLSSVHYPYDKAVTKGQGIEDSGQKSVAGVVCTGYVDLEHGIRSLSPLRPGRVAEIIAKENQHLEAGEVILRLENEDAKLQVEAAESAVTTAEVQLEEARKLEDQQRARLAQQQAALSAAGFRLDAARQMLRRKEDQLKDNVVAADEVTMRRAEVKALEQQEHAEREKLAELKTLDPALAVRKAQSQLKLSRIQRDLALHQLEEYTLKAPATGTVQHISVGAGDIVTGNPAQPIVRFAPDETVLIRADIDQEFVDRVQVGQEAMIRDDTHAGASWHGKVLRIAGWYEQRRPTSQDPAAFSDIRAVECLISIDRGQPPLRIGQRMRVMIGRVPSMGAE